MKKSISLCLMLCLMALAILPAQAGDPYWRGYIKPSEGAVLYAAPKAGAAKRGTLYAGASVYGFLDGAYLDVLDEDEKSLGFVKRTDIEDEKQGFSFPVFSVTREDAPLHTRPGGKGTLIAKHAPGSLGYMLGEVGNSILVFIGGRYGAMAKEDIQITGGTTQGAQWRVVLPVLEEKRLMTFTKHLCSSATGSGDLTRQSIPYNTQTVEVAAWVGDYAQLTNTAFLPKAFLTSSDAAWPVARVQNPKPYDRLNLRFWPEETGTPEGKYFTGVQVSVLSRMGEWAVVALPEGITGYMKADYLAFGTTGDINLLPTMTLLHGDTRTIYIQGTEKKIILQKGDMVQVLGVRDYGLASATDRVIAVVGGTYHLDLPLTQLTATWGPKFSAKVTRGALNLRDTPSTAEGEVVTRLPENARVEVLFRGNVWSEVLYKDVRGWAMTRYLKFMD